MPVEVRNLSHTYMRGTPFETKALRDVCLSIRDGEFLGVIGHTGSGKSTLITHLNALIRPEEGTVIVNGIDLSDKNADFKAVRRMVGLVFQYPEYQLFEETVAKDIAYGPKNLGLDDAEVNRRVNAALSLVDLDPKYLNASPFDLSGGQKRRVAIAGVLAMKPDVLVLDEPAAGLDPAGRRSMLDLVRSLHDVGRTVVMVSHSMDDVGRLCDRLIVMNRGAVAFDGTPAEVFAHPDELSEMGLDVPQCVRLCMKLRKAGFDLPEGITTVEDTAAAILRLLGKAGESHA